MTVDFDFAHHGSICLLTPRTPAGSDWIDEHLPEDAQKWGMCSIVIEPRYVEDILDGVAAAGLTIEGIKPMTRPIHSIAHDIARAWPKPYFGAVPYLRAMLELRDIEDSYGYDSAKSIVLYFLSNATKWRGDDARRLKAELKDMVK